MKSRQMAVIGVVAVCIVTMASAVFAGDRKRDRKRDGTCRTLIVKTVAGVDQGAQYYR